MASFSESEYYSRLQPGTDEPSDPRDDDPDEALPPPLGEADVIDWMVQDEEHAAQLTDEVLGAWDRYERIKESCKRMMVQAKRDAQAKENLYKEPLRRWAAKQLAGKTRKSMRLPTGSLFFKRVGPRLAFPNKGQTLAWALERLPDAVEHDPRLLTGVVQEHALKTGEIPPGAEMLEGGDTFRLGAK